MSKLLLPNGVDIRDVIANLNSFATLPTTSRAAGEIIYYSGDNTIRWNSQTTNPTTNPTWSNLSTGGGVTDHGALTGLTDDDHTQYMPVSASRNFTGDVSIDTATPSLDFAEGGSFRGGVYVNATDDFVMECELGKIILGTDPTNGDVIEINPKAGGVVATFNLASISFAQPLAMGGNKITGLGTPTADSDAATKGYADTLPGVDGVSFILDQDNAGAGVSSSLRFNRGSTDGDAAIWWDEGDDEFQFESDVGVTIGSILIDECRHGGSVKTSRNPSTGDYEIEVASGDSIVFKAV